MEKDQVIIKITSGGERKKKKLVSLESRAVSTSTLF